MFRAPTACQPLTVLGSFPGHVKETYLQGTPIEFGEQQVERERARRNMSGNDFDGRWERVHCSGGQEQRFMEAEMPRRVRALGSKQA